MDKDNPSLFDCRTSSASVTGNQETGAIFLLPRAQGVVISSLAHSHRTVILIYCDIDKYERNLTTGMFLKAKINGLFICIASILVNDATHSSAVS